MEKFSIIPLLALILCFMVGCQDKEAMAELESFKAQAAVEAKNIELIKRYIEEMNKGSIEIFKEFYAPDCLFYSPSNRLDSKKSEEERIENYKMGYRMIPDLNLSIEELFAVGDRVIVRAIMTGTHEGDSPDLPATGRKIEVSLINILQIKNGKIIETRIEMDSMGWVMQSGQRLKPREEEK